MISGNKAADRFKTVQLQSRSIENLLTLSAAAREAADFLHEGNLLDRKGWDCDRSTENSLEELEISLL